MPSYVIKNVLTEAHRVLKPGGTMAIIDLNPKNLNENLAINLFRKWAFEVTEPHIFDYYRVNMTNILGDLSLRNIEVRNNDPINLSIICQK